MTLLKFVNTGIRLAGSSNPRYLVLKFKSPLSTLFFIFIFQVV